jgi:hypothetical protein
VIGFVPKFVDVLRAIRAIRAGTADTGADAGMIQERKALVIWFLFLLPGATLAGIAALFVLYLIPS